MGNSTKERERVMEHPCNGCTAEAIDHAIICPVLGVIASGRCKRIRTTDAEKAFDKLHGWAVVPNRRQAVKLRSAYFATDAYLPGYTGTVAWVENGQLAERLVPRTTGQGQRRVARLPAAHAATGSRTTRKQLQRATLQAQVSKLVSEQLAKQPSRYARRKRRVSGTT